jgi:hypothetical protein
MVAMLSGHYKQPECCTPNAARPAYNDDISKKSWANLPCFPCYPEGGIIWDNLEEDLRAITSRLSHQSPDLPSLEHCHACGLTHNAIVDSLQ